MIRKFKKKYFSAVEKKKRFRQKKEIFQRTPVYK